MQSVDIYGTCFCPAPIIRELPNGDCALPLALNQTVNDGKKVNIPAVVTPSVAGFVAIVAFTIITAVRYSRYQEQQIWLIPADKLDVSDSRVLGQGSFGLVVTGTYQGATVALKRALVNRRRVNGSGNSSRDLKSAASNAKSLPESESGGDKTADAADSDAAKGIPAAVSGESGGANISWIPSASGVDSAMMPRNRQSLDLHGADSRRSISINQHRRSTDTAGMDSNSADATAVNIGVLDAHSVPGPAGSRAARRASHVMKRTASCCCASSEDDEQAPGFVRSVESKARSERAECAHGQCSAQAAGHHGEEAAKEAG